MRTKEKWGGFSVQGEQMDLTENQNGRIAHLCWRQALCTHVFVVLRPCRFFPSCSCVEQWGVNRESKSPLEHCFCVSVSPMLQHPLYDAAYWTISTSIKYTIYLANNEQVADCGLQISRLFFCNILEETYKELFCLPPLLLLFWHVTITLPAVKQKWDDNRERQSARYTKKIHSRRFDKGCREATRWWQNFWMCQKAMCSWASFPSALVKLISHLTLCIICCVNNRLHTSTFYRPGNKSSEHKYSLLSTLSEVVISLYKTL